MPGARIGRVLMALLAVFVILGLLLGALPSTVPVR
jgi:hypothetical protein